jgi:hypothetical protein
MGKQKGDAARSKARPSSSSLAASLLPSGATSVGFGGYVGSSRLDTALATQDATPYLDIDGEVAQHLKRLSRKDPTTKLKALTSLSALIKEKSSNSKEILPIIPQWGFEYKKLLLDYNRDVRRATHETMTNLVSVVGRDLAPHLKTLMGPWWFSQFDPVHEVSQAAKRSLQAAFPAQERRLDALVLCTSEIFMYLEENLKLTPQSLSDKAVALDELQEIHQQVISSSLLSFATLLDIFASFHPGNPNSETLTAEPKNASKARSTAITCAEKILSTHKYFLEFLKSQTPPIRSATYSVLCSCIKNIPHAFTDSNLKNVANAILGSFSEKDPTCHSAMWDTILLFSNKFPEGWNTVSVSKTVLSRFWNFLKNGCFGSQQVSYPALVLFLETVPPKAVVGEKFFPDFFQNLWAGRHLSVSSSANRIMFFLAFRECFLWALKNASRYCDGVEAVHNFRHNLIEKILVNLLWSDYLMCTGLKNQKRISADPIQDPPTKPDPTYPSGFFQDLGKCIIELLSGIYSLEDGLLIIFSTPFQENSLNIFQQKNVDNAEKIERIIDFLLLLDQNAVKKDETWPLVRLVGPLLTKSFLLTKTLDSPDTVRLIVICVSIFGPRRITQELITSETTFHNHDSKKKGEFLGSEQFLQVYNEIFIPLCLAKDSNSSDSRLDLLLALLDDECFKEQWNSIITHATNQENQDSSHFSVLALLMDKARVELKKRNSRENDDNLSGSRVEDWHHKLLDSASLSIAHSLPVFGTSGVQFLCSVLGGTIEDDQTAFVGRNTAILIFEEIFKVLRSYLMESPFHWVKDACSLLPDNRNESTPLVDSSARFALEVLGGSLFSLKTFSDRSDLVSGILSAVILIDWEYSLMTAVLDEEPAEKVKDRYTFDESVHDFRRKIPVEFFRTVSIDSHAKLGNILIKSIRFSVFKDDNKLDGDKIASLGCDWTVEVLECLCEEETKEQKMLDQFLSKNDDLWPLYVEPDFGCGKRSAALKTEDALVDESKNHNFVALIDKLISKIGISRVILGSSSKSESHYSRAWLAAEVLCAWKWTGGSVLTSFLPSLITNDSFVDSVVHILLDGALVRGSRGEPNEFVSIKEPFLRGLTYLLHTLYENKIWGKEESVSLFQVLLNKLSLGETVNSNCLRILPVVMSVLIRSLVDGGHESVKSVEIWLQKTLSFPPLRELETGEEIEDWFQLVVSCYPLTESLKPERHASITEKSLLLELLRKQRHHTSSSLNKLPLIQTLLSKLIVVTVGYCSTKFDEQDWDFVLYWVRRWIEPTVVMMEENAENVNDSDPNPNLVIDPNPIKLATNALVAFSLFSRLVQEEKKKDPEASTNPLRIERFEVVKDRILEQILRLFFSTGAAEAIAGYGSLIGSTRLDHPRFWELVAENSITSSELARDKAVKSVEIWGLSKGPVSSLYAILFSSVPVPCMQFAAYVILSTEPVSRLAILEENLLEEEDSKDSSRVIDLALEDSVVPLRSEISSVLEISPYEILEMDLVAPQRVNVYLAWSLILSHLLSLPSSSPTKARLVQHIQDTMNPTILDCIFQHIPLELCVGPTIKKKDAEMAAGVSEIARSATTAIKNSSVAFCVESLWPVVGPEKMASLAGALFGLMLRILPAYVRAWFNDIRDRSVSSSIESFTKSWCSPPLISNELAQIKKGNFSDENFSVSVSKSANEVVATYTKDETGMDLVIRLPSSYPLRSVEVDCTRSLGISEVKKRKWIMSMVSFVRNQNGALAEAIRTWKSNFDKEFEGVEECPICYSVIHTSNHSLPRLACRTCKHKFHSACLYKWFSTSHKSTCPLCQSPF